MHKNQRYKNKKKYGIKTKGWWDQSIQLLFEEVKIAYSNYHKDLTNRKLKNEYQQAKKYFRMRKRYNLELKRTKGLKTLDNLFKLDQKNFWSKIKILTRSNQIVNMELTTIKNEYEKTFTIDNYLTTAPAEIEKKINEIYTKQTANIIVSNTEIESVLRNLPNNKAIGYNGICNEMFKYAASLRLIKTVSQLFNLMMKSEKMPDGFNTSIIKPLVKNSKKPTDQMSNLRPVAISDALSNIFKKILLYKIQTSNPAHEKQFGFKHNSSCGHAVFSLIQTIIFARSNKWRVYCCSLDLSCRVPMTR